MSGNGGENAISGEISAAAAIYYVDNEGIGNDILGV